MFALARTSSMEVFVEQPDERADGAEALLSLALPSSSALRPSLAQVDVVAQRRAVCFSTAVDGQHDLGLGLFQALPGWMPTSAPVPTALSLAPLVKISASGADAHLQVLAPRPWAISTSRSWGLRASRAHAGQVVADHGHHRAAHRLGLAGVAAPAPR